eukprot:6312593-Prorocentrum_lima.AAC.1
MTSSLVGSEMCIRDRANPAQGASAVRVRGAAMKEWGHAPACWVQPPSPCLLYTSDAADDM